MNEQRLPMKSLSDGTAKGKLIYLSQEGERESGRVCFQINGVLGEGGACICYEATLVGEKKTGRLKEFYPQESLIKNAPFLLVRDEENHLVATEETKDAFLSARNDYVAAYHLLQDVVQENKNNSDFTSFIPDFRIFCSCDTAGHPIDGGTVYIWTAAENLLVFEDYIAQVKQHPSVYPERKLFTILKSVLSLTECVKILHENGLLHLDIKPANFGIPKRADKLLTDTITLFDVNSICSMQGSLVSEYGTEGFSAPEIGSEMVDNTSDIYSIGCTLFYALTAGENLGAPGYFGTYYTQIEQLYDASPLIAASKTNADIYLRNKLIPILKRCLSEFQANRYQSCSDLIADLQDALTRLYPAQINAMLPPDKEVVILDKEKQLDMLAQALDKKSGAGTYLTLMYHLYKKPLFEFLPPDSDTMDVLIIGFGNYGQRFLDCCLQVGQSLGKTLNVKVVSNDRAEGKRDRDIYLSARPAITDFFHFDEKRCRDAYGSIVFENREFVRDDLSANREIVTQIVNEYNQGRYIFIALGDDKLNKGVAQAIANIKGTEKCSINYVCENERVTGKAYGNPISMSENIVTEPLYRDIERMAFNAHLTWESEGGADLKKAWAKFKDPYYYKPSFSNVISIKYKLYRLGIPMDDLSLAATEYYKRIVLSSDGIKDELIALEHRRWVCEKICDGWVCNRNLEACAFGPHNDRKTKKHVCIVRSSCGAPLQTAAWHAQRWDTADEETLAALDELDCVSVKLHQVYQAAADRLRKETPLLDLSMLRLREMANTNEKVGIAFSEWYSCMALLWNGNSKFVREYPKLRNAFADSLVLLPHEEARTAKFLVKLIDDRFSVLLKSIRYTDFKNNDTAMVERIPFVLTHKKDTRLLIPFSTGCNTEIFGNVAAATVVDPSFITYVYHFGKRQEVEAFKDALRYTLNYLAEKKIAAKLTFLLSYKKDEKLRKTVEALKAEMLGGKKQGVRQVVLIASESDADIAQGFLSVLGKKHRFDAAERNETQLSYLLLGAGFYSKSPNYRFDIQTREFDTSEDCAFLQFIQREQYLRISDIFASKNSKGHQKPAVAFYNDYERLWKSAYRQNEFVWQKMCRLLCAYHEKADSLISVRTDAAREKELFCKYRFLLPAEAYEGVKKLIAAFTEAKIFDKSSTVYFYTTDSCEVTVYASRSIAASLKRIMSDPYVLSQPDSMQIVKTADAVSVFFERLTVKDLDLSAAGEHAAGIMALLHCLETDFAFITGLSTDPENERIVRFGYATKRIKKLLTSPGNILEVYIYYKCLKSGLFDDIATGYEINWEGTSVTSEFDVILTKGFAGLLVEAKATEDIDQEHYFKLSCLAKQFGTNCLPVLVIDTPKDAVGDVQNDEMQRLGGDMLDVFTISDPTEIDTIDTTLARLLRIEPRTAAAAPTLEHLSEMTSAQI